MQQRIVVLAALCGSLVCWGGNDRRQREMEDFGGYVVKPAVGFVAVVDCESGFDMKQFDDLFFPRGKCMRIPYRTFKEAIPFDVRTADARFKALSASAAIFIGKDAALPLSLAAVESKWAFVNYGKLAEDNPDAATLKKRMDKMFSRATMAILGAGSFMEFPSSAAKYATNLKELDQVKGVSPAPQAMMSMDLYIRKMGIVFAQDATYEQACQEGWAPAPTNDAQKAIWDEVHAPPTKPIKITYDKGKQKPVVK